MRVEVVFECTAGDSGASYIIRAHVACAAVSLGRVQNTAMTWGVVVNKKDGLAFVNDMFNGLWIVQLEPKSPITP